MDNKPMATAGKSTRMIRKHFFVHTSSQLKYIAMSVLPAFLMSVFCTFFVFKSGQFIIEREKYKLFIEISSFNQTIKDLENEHYTPETKEKIQKLQQELRSIQDVLKITYFDTIREWEKTKTIILIILPVVLVILGFIALIYSHRVAGPLLRLRKSMDMLAEGKDVQVFRFRDYDEFKELAISFERLRKSLKDKGILK